MTCRCILRCVHDNIQRKTNKWNSLHTQFRYFHVTCQKKRPLVLGIESSCDDTGAAIVDESGHILGDALYSQHLIHLNHGGIIPPIAKDLHIKYINPIVSQALERAGVTPKDLSAIATTVKPGLPMSLMVGLLYGTKMAKEHNKPFIPIHHMQAHALTVRMVEKVNFPFMVFLVSGGHCLLAVVKDVDEFYLLGNELDDAPGEALDKVARRLKLRNIPGYETLSGGGAIEKMAKLGDHLSIRFPVVMTQTLNCNFSFAGLKQRAQEIIQEEEQKYGIVADEIIPTVANFCASFQYAVARHMIRRLERALIYAEAKGFIPERPKSMVLSGGVACNEFIRDAVRQVCNKYDYELFCPPPKLCTDNGIMIAWNGMEKWIAGKGITKDIDSITVENKSLIGKSLIEDVENTRIRLRNPVKLVQNKDASQETTS
ncbi:tRNA N6-adenosine threonylcarbamoyltransferase, mitochondrial-like [Artemia franciscana]|uniref:tRNA N6-adenosine threonylcarbamoyltransferase, mitochondrial-like n=1 Tax=Artemia franciscana TaxID=6661 RepID=UPI0032DA0F56